MDVLGQQLQDFLSAQFQAPAGSSTVLAFLPAGIAVDPQSLYVGEQVNPMLVQEWLRIVADPLAEIVGGSATTAQAHASTVMQAIALFATPTAPIGSDAANIIGRLKSLANSATTPVSDVVDAAPLDWFDPSVVPTWPAHSTTATAQPASTGTGGGLPAPIPIHLPPIWAWRHLPAEGLIHRRPGPDPADVTSQDNTNRQGAGDAGLRLTPVRAFRPFEEGVSSPLRKNPAAMSRDFNTVSTTDPGTTVVTQTEASHSTAAVARISPEVAASTISLVAAGAGESGQPPPTASPSANGVLRTDSVVLLDRNWLGAQSQIAAAADSAPVDAASLTLSLRYRLVQLSRSAWWSDLLVAAPGWCFAGQPAGSLVPGTLPSGTCVGMPVALVLTDEVSVTGTWTDGDKAALADSTHFGPWQLSAGEGSSGAGSLQIPGMQAIAVIYQVLPILPPDADPGLAAPPT